MTLQLPINYWPQINLTHYVFNTSRNDCTGPIVSYSAFQSNCFTNFETCCRDLAVKDNITLDTCNSNEIYNCAQVTNPPNAEVIGAFEWVLIVSGAISLIFLAFFILIKFYKCVCGSRGQYSEL